MSKTSQQLGKMFEAQVMRGHPFPWLIKVPTARVPKGQRNAGAPCKRTWLDFVGSLPGGRSVTFDAKFIGTRERVVASLLKPHQRKWCDWALEAGSMVFVYAGAYHDGRIVKAVVPWSVLREERGVSIWDYEVSSLRDVLDKEF